MYNNQESEIVRNSNKTVKNETQSTLFQLLNSPSLRITAEKIILLCATDYRFANLPPSVVASAALMSAIQQEICQSQRNQPLRRSVLIQTQDALHYSTPTTSSGLFNGSGQITSSTSNLKDINLNQIVARLQMLTRVQMVSPDVIILIIKDFHCIY